MQNKGDILLEFDGNIWINISFHMIDIVYFNLEKIKIDTMKVMPRYHPYLATTHTPFTFRPLLSLVEDSNSIYRQIVNILKKN